MTGHTVQALNLRPGNVVHLAPHTADGVPVSRSLDADVEHVRVMGTVVVIDWREHPGYTGADAEVTGATAYDAAAGILVLGGAA